jgi:outer membrane protein assembly factor BamB
VAIAQQMIFTMGEADNTSYVYALSLEGKPRWKASLGKAGEQGGYYGPRSTPTVVGEHVYCLGQFGDLVCLTVKDGREVWRRQLRKDFAGNVGGWGYSESPLVDGDRVIVTPGGKSGTMVALNKMNGELIWRTTAFTDNAEYSSAILAEPFGVKQYIQLTGESVAGIDAEGGKLLWRAARRGSTAVIPTPIFHDNSVYVTSGYGVGCNLFALQHVAEKFSTRQVYANKVMVNHHGGVVLHEGHIYGYSDGKGWTCQNFKTGEMVWSNKSVDKGSLCYADGRLYLRGEGSHGTVALVEASPAAYKEVGRFDQPERSDKNSWPHPVVCGGRLYLRDQDLLLCYDVKAK